MMIEPPLSSDLVRVMLIVVAVAATNFGAVVGASGFEAARFYVIGEYPLQPTAFLTLYLDR